MTYCTAANVDLPVTANELKVTVSSLKKDMAYEESIALTVRDIPTWKGLQEWNPGSLPCG